MKIADIRFFTTCLIDNDDGMHEIDMVEITETQFKQLHGVISYDRYTVFNNGVNQVCLTIECNDLPLIEDLDIIN